jgi:hypothetical protein
MGLSANARQWGRAPSTVTREVPSP